MSQEQFADTVKKLESFIAEKDRELEGVWNLKSALEASYLELDMRFGESVTYIVTNSQRVSEITFFIFIERDSQRRGAL